MAFDLNPVALTSAPLLRAIAAPGWESIADIARHAGRDPKNMSRDMAIVRRAGLVAEDEIALTPEGLAQLAALERAADLTAVAPGGPLTALHAEIEPHPNLNPRKDFETQQAEDDLDELRISVVKKGVLQPILVRPRPDRPGQWWIIAGERRWRAVGQAIFDGDWDEDRGLPITVREVDDAEHLELSLLENIQRSNMLPIEEAVGIGRAINEFGAKKPDLADRMGKTVRWVELRLQLLTLSPDDQDRMRLPKGHPDRLGFKAALALLQTPKEKAEAPAPGNPWDHGGFGDAVKGRLHEAFGIDLVNGLTGLKWKIEDAYRVGATADETAETIAAEYGLTFRDPEPGSQPVGEAAPTFDDRIDAREALLLVEIADKSDRQPDDLLGSEHYTACLPDGMKGAAGGLVTKELIAFRFRGTSVLVRPRLFTSGYREWLDGLGFYGPHRADVLFEMRARVHGPEVARTLAEQGAYATGWLNPPADLPDLPNGARPIAHGPGAAYARELTEQPRPVEPEQPELIEASDDERVARIRAENERHADARARNTAEQYARQIGDWMAFARSRGANDYLNPCIGEDGLTVGALKPEDMAAQVIRAVVRGDLSEAGALIATLNIRAGILGAPQALRRLPDDQVHQLVTEARA